jgi:hypothetical protein
MANVNNTTPQVQTLVLQEGQSGYIPSNALILAVDGTGVANSNGCINVTPQPSICLQFTFSLEDNDSDNFDATDGATIKSISINNVEYDINLVLMSPSGSTVLTSAVDFVNVAGVSESQLTSTNSNSQRTYVMTIKCPVQYKETSLLKLTFSTGRYPNGMYLKPIEVSCPSF